MEPKVEIPKAPEKPVWYGGENILLFPIVNRKGERFHDNLSSGLFVNALTVKKYRSCTKLGFFLPPIMNHPQQLDPRRLPNLGETCYMNAALQLLFQYNPFREHLRPISSTGCLLVKDISKLFAIMAGEIEGTAEGKQDLLLQIQSESGIEAGQQDASDFMVKVFDKTGFIQPLYFQEEISCDQCTSSSKPTNIDYFLTLPVKECVSLQNSVECAQREEYVEYFCSECNETRWCSKTTKFCPPENLPMPDEVVVKFMLFDDQGKIKFNEKFRSLEDLRLGECKYKPKCVVEHTGASIDNGHYIFCDLEKKKIINDDLISNLKGGVDLGRFPVYMALYKKINEEK